MAAGLGACDVTPGAAFAAIPESRKCQPAAMPTSNASTARKTTCHCPVRCGTTLRACERREDDLRAIALRAGDLREEARPDRRDDDLREVDLRAVPLREDALRFAG